MEIDFSLMSYEDWLEFIFNRPVIEDPWEGIGVSLSGFADRPMVIVNHLTKLCMEFHLLRNRFSWKQIDQGVWSTLMFPVEAVDHLIGDEVPLEEFITCVESMYFVFADTFAKMENGETEGTCHFMWWDVFGMAFCIRYGHRTNEVFVPKDERVRRMQDTIFGTLVRILDLPDTRCQDSALHGLGHLHHPKGAEVVQKYIDQHGHEMDTAGLEWVIRCRDGTVM